MMSKTLFDNFEKVSAKEWKQKIQFDLKGADYNEALIHRTLEGIDIRPFYTNEDLSDTYTVTTTSSWRNAQKIDVIDAITANKIALEDIKKGAESIYFRISDSSINPEELIAGITEKTILYIETLFLSQEYAQVLENAAGRTKLSIYYINDPIGKLAATGNWFQNGNEDLQKTLTICNNNTHLRSCLSIDMALYQNAGATIVQQLAYGLAHANEYLNQFNNSTKKYVENYPIVFKIAIGGNYFFEIAKLRAFRLLWSSLASEYEILKKSHILAYPSHRNKTILDYNVNMLRTTTECMSAILGGADTILNNRYDDIYHHDNDFGRRIAINQLLILKNESYFDIVHNPAAGSYYIESITKQLADKALLLFKNIEQGGGFLEHLKSGTAQKKIKESAEKEQLLFDQEQIVLTGTNKYRNKNEITPDMEKAPFPEKNIHKTLFAPIIKRRLAETMEKETLTNTNNMNA
ncbi:methylmalonyl-CoA mutase subunit beta [Aquimarina sp. TRL1]|uniref:methylmalonyl-CoA mutase subunit beta n=1 Tax=Aquimarina sp. (strain TRL1) TaxID=2736252 RepID=UPI0034CF9B32